MQDYELDAWLGDTETTTEQRAALHAVATALDDRYPRDGEEDEWAEDRAAAFTGAAQVILGDATVTEAVEAWRRAHLTAEEARAAMTGALIASTVGDRIVVDGKIVDLGMTEAELLRATDLARGTIRKALGR